jgi:hypothetical protein
LGGTDLDSRKIVALRDIACSELGHKPARPIVRAVGMAVIHNPYAGKYAEDLRRLCEAGAGLGERLTPELGEMLDAPPVCYGQGAIVGVQGADRLQGRGRTAPRQHRHPDRAQARGVVVRAVSIADLPRPHEILTAW